MTVELTRYQLLLILKAIRTSQFPEEDQKAAYELAVRLNNLTSL
jgi:hypothetical protein